MARLLHTGDWHLGRILHGEHLTEEQQILLDQLVAIVESERPDAVLIAGDIYDRAVPPPDAVRLLDDVLTRIVNDLKVPVVMIAGNHDSPDRLGFGSRLLEAKGLVVAGAQGTKTPRLRLLDEHGPLDIYALPFVELERVRSLFPDADVGDQAAATRWMLDRIRDDAEVGVRRVLVGHAFVTGGLVAESERPLSVGGAATVDADQFDGFDYVALGHLHRRQAIGDRIRYSGSLYKYSFSEAKHTKSVDIVTIGAPGQLPQVKTVAFSLRRDLRRLDGTMDELLGAPAQEGRDDYLSVMLRDTGLVFDAIGKLRAVYPNVLHIERPQAQLGDVAAPTLDRRKMTHGELFRQFFSEVTGTQMTEDQIKALDLVLEAVRRTELEVAK